MPDLRVLRLLLEVFIALIDYLQDGGGGNHPLG
jgi:hypothetical protein